MNPNEFYQLLQRRERFTSQDLQSLREGLMSASSVFANEVNTAWFNGSLTIETISSLAELNESIRKLDDGTTNLVNTTNKLTTYILWLTGGAFFLGVVQVVVAILQFHR